MPTLYKSTHRARTSSSKSQLSMRKLLANTDRVGGETETYRKLDPQSYNANTMKGSHTISMGDMLINEMRRKSLHEILFDSSAGLKRQTSLVSMHLQRGWKETLFRQMDRLFDEENWESEDLQPNAKSFNAFLKAICDIKPNVHPGIGLDYNGNFTAAWTDPAHRLTLSFEPSEKVRMIFTEFIDDEPEISTCHIGVGRLKERLRGFHCEKLVGLTD